MKRCSKGCSGSVHNNEKYCTNCGSELEPLPRCCACNYEFLSYDKYCRNCGLPRNKALQIPSIGEQLKSFWEKIRR